MKNVHIVLLLLAFNAMAALWLFWPSDRMSISEIEARISEGIRNSEQCGLNAAQSALIDLRMNGATPEQLGRLEDAMNADTVRCERKRVRGKAWADTSTAVESALATGDFAHAQARLVHFTRRYSDDDETRKLRDRIARQRAAVQVQADAERGPLSSAQTAQSARSLINEAERALMAGHYKSASDKLETCLTTVDEGNRECAAFKVHVDRMLKEQARCHAAGRTWSADRCQ